MKKTKKLNRNAKWMGTLSSMTLLLTFNAYYREEWSFMTIFGVCTILTMCATYEEFKGGKQ